MAPCVCPYANCSKTFVNKWNMMRHWRQVHEKKATITSLSTTRMAPSHPLAWKNSQGLTTNPSTDSAKTPDSFNDDEDVNSLFDVSISEPSLPATAVDESPVLVDFHCPVQSPPLYQRETPEIRSLRRIYDQDRSECNERGSDDQRITKKRKWLGDSFKASTPEYPVKRSKKHHTQQRAVSWLTTEGKIAFDRRKANILAQWGLSSSHKGTCLLLPGTWNNINPVDLISRLRRDNFPLRDESRLNYRYDDHCTSFSRAAAWYDCNEWPRRGIDLDTFLQCGPFSSMDGSHLCHQDNCVIHLVYEPTYVNLHRKECRKHAEFLRGEGLDVPPYCNNENHQPPCLMQHAALTTLECYLIQGSVLRQSKGLADVERVLPSQWHRFRTFEDRLPLLFCSNSLVTFNAHESPAERPPDSRTESLCESIQPILRCAFCSDVIYRTITGMWSHIRREHAGEPTRLDEIRRTATVWRDYLEAKGDRKKTRPTYLKLNQVLEAGFSWDTVVSWQLPYN